jgi:arginase
MDRRDFLRSSVAAVSAPLFAGKTDAAALPLVGLTAAPTYHFLGVPLRSGSLVPGNENDAQAYRDAQFISRLKASGCNAVDDGDVAIPSYLPHHTVPPIRSWPGPRIAWDCISERVAPYLQLPGQIPFLIGCDCSVVVGTAQALQRASSNAIYVLYVDGDFDDAAPVANHCNSAAACAAWLLTHDSPFSAGPPLRPSNLTVIGWTSPSSSTNSELNSVSLAEVRRTSPSEAAQRALQSIPPSASIILHFDTDVVQARELPSAYFPHEEGLTLSEAGQLLRELLKDPRIRVIEVSEYASLRDRDRTNVAKLIALFADNLPHAV